jgi:plasmid stabilization system protein ParE
MAHIKLLDPFKKELRDMVVYTLAEFGATSVKRFNKELDDIKHRLMLHPLSSPREPLLKRFHRPYHSAIIYRYDEANDLVIFVDLWDMRRSPRYLIRQFKRKL